MYISSFKMLEFEQPSLQLVFVPPNTNVERFIVNIMLLLMYLIKAWLNFYPHLISTFFTFLQT